MAALADEHSIHTKCTHLSGRPRKLLTLLSPKLSRTLKRALRVGGRMGPQLPAAGPSRPRVMRTRHRLFSRACIQGALISCSPPPQKARLRNSYVCCCLCYWISMKCKMAPWPNEVLTLPHYYTSTVKAGPFWPGLFQGDLGNIWGSGRMAGNQGTLQWTPLRAQSWGHGPEDLWCP